jgi:arginine N-succinyltransferase
MSTPGRPKGEHRSAKHESNPMSLLRVRDAIDADLPTLARWLPQSPPTLPPAGGAERLLVADVADPGGAPPGRLLATLRLHPAIGLDLPRAWYHVGCTVHAARDLALFHRQRTLLLGNDHTGASEIADIAMAGGALSSEGGGSEPSLAEQAQALRLLLQTTLLLMARQRGRYAASVIAELPGPGADAGSSPFWHGLGRHFYSGDPATARAQHGAAWVSHLAALLPRQPVYTSFLPPAAQAAIAQVAPAARLLRELLEEAGLRYSRHITIADGGPVLEADLDALPGVTGSRVWTVADASGTAAGTLPWLLASEDAAGRLLALKAPALATGTRLALGSEVRVALGLEVGSAVWALAG